MDIYKTMNGEQMILALEGRLDTVTSPDLQDALLPEVRSGADIVLDFQRLGYVSSAGLRVILSAQKSANKCGAALTLRNVCRDIMEVFEMTGFVDILYFENSVC